MNSNLGYRNPYEDERDPDNPYDEQCADCDAPIVSAESTVVRKFVNGLYRHVFICAECDQRFWPVENADDDSPYDIAKEDGAA